MSTLIPPHKDDPALGNFLFFMEENINNHPEHIKEIDPALFARAESLVSGIKVDLETSLSKQDE